MVQRDVIGASAENSETCVHGFNTTEDVFDVSALLLLVECYPFQIGGSMIQLPPHQDDLPALKPAKHRRRLSGLLVALEDRQPRYQSPTNEVPEGMEDLDHQSD